MNQYLLKFGVPDSQLANHITDVNIHCTSEEQAMAIAAGCILCKKKPIVYMQNSGLLRCGDVITSLYKPYKIPLPSLLLSIRHHPAHHEYAGKITKQFLKLMKYDGKIRMIEQVVKNEKTRKDFRTKGKRSHRENQ
jgi:sulfopyruvate decarboxylase TPP-binding subunit